jgi:acetyl-CoA synthetase
MILITPTIRLPLKPGSVSRPFPTIEVDVVDKNGQPTELEEGGFLVIRHPWPAQMRGTYKVGQMWGDKSSIYITGDTATVDRDGDFRIQGHVDDVIEVSGHPLGLMEIESSLVSHPAIAEAVAIGKPDLLKGKRVKVFVILKQGFAPSEKLEKDLQKHILTTVGVLAVPDELEFAPGLPKTCSYKIVQRVIRSLELNVPVG